MEHPLNYKLISSTTEVESLLPTIMEKASWGLDTETTGLDPLKDKVMLLQIGSPDVQYLIDTRKASPEPLRPFFESRRIKKLGHNLKFDYKMIKSNFGIELEALRDTFLAEKILMAGKKFSGFGLDAVVYERLGVKIEKAERQTFGQGMITGDFTENQLRYSAIDVIHLHHLTNNMCDKLAEENLQHTWVLECDVLPCFGDMELAGHYLDVAKWRGIMDDNLKQAKDLEEEMNEIASQVMPVDLFGQASINYGSPQQVLELLRVLRVTVKERTPQGGWADQLITKTDDKTLKKIKNVPIVQTLKKWRSLMIRVNTFGQPYIDAISPVTGKVHPEFHQIGTETGRPAKAGQVNFLNIPRDKAMRECFHGEDTEFVETDDFSGCELRIWAEISGDPKLMEAFQRGVDVHCYVATMLYRREVTKSNENKHLRTPTKTLNFGIAYGMGAYGLYDKVNGDGYPLSMEEAKKLFADYNEQFKTGVDFLRDAGRQAAKHGYLHNILGRRRYWSIPDHTNAERFPKGFNDPKYVGIMAGIEREGGNFLIQSVNADITKYAMVLIRNHIKEHKVRSHFMNQVYDEIVTRTHKDDSPDFVQIKRKLMVEAAERWIKNVPMEVEGHVGSSWTK